MAVYRMAIAITSAILHLMPRAFIEGCGRILNTSDVVDGMYSPHRLCETAKDAAWSWQFILYYGINTPRQLKKRRIGGLLK